VFLYSAPNYNVPQASPHELHLALERSKEAHLHLRTIPAPRRGELLRQIREALSAKVRSLFPLRCAPFKGGFISLQRDVLGALVSLEMGKIKTEGIGEVQEFVDIVRIFFLLFRC
jgi:aldehyde dehydrogenase family 7 protein A1